MAIFHKKKIRYAVVGLGHIAQAAILPGFANTKNSELAALVSGDDAKLRELGEKYSVERLYSYNGYEECLTSGDVDAVFIALPNNMHCEYTVRAARAGVHVLCEKPMAVTEDECQQMIDACDERQLKLMIAYRLHFEKGNLAVIKAVESGEIGYPRVFNSLFNMRVADDNIRTKRELGGGTLYDIGIYCINAARYLFRAEPTRVTALSASNRDDDRFREIDESTSAVMHFPGERLAAFTTSFGAADVSTYQVAGTKGDLRMDPAYGYSAPLQYFLTVEGKTTRRTFKKRDQFGAEIAYFSSCILKDTDPEPSGKEGLADVRIIRALYKSAESGRSVELETFEPSARPSKQQEIHKPAVSEPEVVHAESPHR
ncbi:MAG TPA: Gfo/Idh/MocA family oxidoreductase [Pirellulales bacterium]|jgi:glucose-fructose oxidoreductase